jgi:hypothetical protein
MRVLRLLILLCSAVAVVLFVAVLILWIHSPWFVDQVTHVAVVRPGEPEWWRAYKARSYRGRLFFSVLECDENAGVFDRSYLGWRVQCERNPRIGLPRPRGAIERLGFGAGGQVWAANPARHRFVYVPHWFALIVLGAASAPLITRVRHFLRARRRARGGMCRACGYDMRSTPDRCPECGTASLNQMPRG